MIHAPEALRKLSKNQEFLQVIETLNQAGFKAYVAGGAVRDAFIGRELHDIDIVTNASVEDLQKCFKKTILVGAQFGVVIVVIGEQKFEVAQFRKEADYQDGRRPNLVEPGTPEQDAYRRDFTMNALFYDPITHQIIDYVGGIPDIAGKQIRTVGNPDTRFTEDHLRILRAMRFEAQLGFEIEQATINSLLAHRHLLNNVSRERLTQELCKLIQGDFTSQVVAHDWFWEVLIDLVPELSAPAATKTLKFVKQADPITSWSYLFFKTQQPADAQRLFFEKLILSREQKSELTKVAKALVPQTWAGLDLGSQLLLTLDPVMRLVATWLFESRLDLFSLKRQEQLLQKWKDWQTQKGVPAPLVKAADLPQSLKGAKIKQALDLCYAYQLEHGAQDKLQILTHVQGSLQSL